MREMKVTTGPSTDRPGKVYWRVDEKRWYGWETLEYGLVTPTFAPGTEHPRETYNELLQTAALRANQYVSSVILIDGGKTMERIIDEQR